MGVGFDNYCFSCACRYFRRYFDLECSINSFGYALPFTPLWWSQVQLRESFWLESRQA